ncbi:MAG: ABC transporter ATP-binding protein [Candidatus Rokubacteria bacterium]|nr:ABC transporter ATP-binding protein [Candidatus Rokubacteria bacterium]
MTVALKADDTASAAHVPASRPLVHLSSVCKWYEQGSIRTVVLAETSLAVEEGQFVVVLGPSGSGKSTLLNLIGAMDTPSSGSVFVAGAELGRSSPAMRTAVRRDKIGFIFQFYNLFPTLTAAENVEAGLEVLGLPRLEVRRRTREYLTSVGLADRAGAFPGQLSGGQQQRVAIARALAKEPPLVLADEPTGNLDRDTGEQIVRLMRDLNDRTGAAFIVVTHNAEIARAAHRVVHILDGQIVET